MIFNRSTRARILLKYCMDPPDRWYYQDFGKPIKICFRTMILDASSQSLFLPRSRADFPGAWIYHDLNLIFNISVVWWIIEIIDLTRILDRPSRSVILPRFWINLWDYFFPGPRQIFKVTDFTMILEWSSRSLELDWISPEFWTYLRDNGSSRFLDRSSRNLMLPWLWTDVWDHWPCHELAWIFKLTDFSDISDVSSRSLIMPWIYDNLRGHWYDHNFSWVFANTYLAKISFAQSRSHSLSGSWIDLPDDLSY